MQKLVVVIGLVSLLGLGFSFYTHMMSDEMRLERLGYSKEVIHQLMEEKTDVVEKLIEDKINSDEIIDYLFVKNFNYDCYEEYVDFKEQYPNLEASEVVYLASFLDHVFIPSLLQYGYQEDTLSMWFQSPKFNEYIKQVDMVSLNNILNFAKETGQDLYTLIEYVKYEQRYPNLKLNDVVSEVDEYQEVILPELKQKGYVAQDIQTLYEQFHLNDLRVLVETDLLPDQTLELMTASGFNSSNLAIYDKILNADEKYTVTYALQYAKYPNVKSNFYQDIVSTPNPDSLLVLVNKNYQLSKTYIPSDFIPVDVSLSEFAPYETNYLRRDAADATEQLFEAAQAAGYSLTLRTGFLSYESQKKRYEQDVYEMGIEYTETISTRPGHSEHQTGLAIDVTSPSVNNELTVDFANTLEGQWVLTHAHEYGFIIRYPEGKEDELGYTYQPWHLRYVGKEVAKEIYENEWTLEDYILMYEILDQ